MEDTRAGVLQDRRNRFEHRLCCGLGMQVQPERMIRAAVRLHYRKMVREILFMLFRVSLRTHRPVLFIHPRNHTNRALRFEMKFLNEVRRFHRNSDTGAVVDRACSQIP